MTTENEIYKLTKIILKRVRDKIKYKYHNAFNLNLSIRELYEYEETGQIRCKVTIDICDLFMQEIYHYGDEVLKEMGSPIKIDKRNEDKSEDGKSFDICFVEGNDKEQYEIKFSQNEDGFQGSTHGKNKVNRYLLINFHFDLDKVINDDIEMGIFGNTWIGISDKPLNFLGEATDKNSRTFFQFTMCDYSFDDMCEITKHGFVSKKRKYWRLVGEKLKD